MDKKSTRDGFGIGIIEITQKDERIVAISADLAESVRLKEFKEKFPERFVECGVAEQNMATIASGMANYGKIPFMASYAIFSPGRNWEQIRTAIAINNFPVKIVGSHAGIITGADGVTHQALEDIAIMRCLPNMTVIIPCDAEEARKATIASVEIGGPVYIRLSREATPVLTREDDEFKIGKANILRAGKDVTIVGCGWILSEAILASEDLAKEGIECEVINMHTVSPIDTETLVGSVNKTGCIVSAEDHQVEGGLGSAIAQTLAFVRPTPQEFVAVIRQFGQSGTAGELIKRYGLDAESIKDKVRKVITRK